ELTQPRPTTPARDLQDRVRARPSSRSCRARGWRRGLAKSHGFFSLKRFICRKRSIYIQAGRVRMKRQAARCLVMGACVSALVCMVFAYAGAQQAKGQPSTPAYAGAGKAPSKALPDGGPTPRLSDGHPDLSGIWFVGALGKEDATLVQSAASQGDPALKAFDPKVTPEEKPSFQPWAAEKVKQTGRE